MLRWPEPKDPDATRTYTVDWGSLGALDGDTITASDFTVLSGTVTLADKYFTSTISGVEISGGVQGERAQLHCVITTSGGNTIDETIELWVVATSLDNSTRYTKGDLVTQALDDLGISSYVFDIEAEEDISALRKLDNMMADLQTFLNPLGYLPPATSGSSLPSDPVGIDESIVQAVVAMLAVRIAPSYGKTPSQETRAAARDGRSNIVAAYSKTIELILPARTPTGAGNRRWGRRTYFSGLR